MNQRERNWYDSLKSDDKYGSNKYEDKGKKFYFGNLAPARPKTK